MGRRSRGTIAVRTAGVLLLALTAGGTVRLFAGPAGAQTATSPAAQGPLQAGLARGTVAVNPAVGSLAGEIALGRTRTQDGAVAAFASYVVWLIGSPAAAADPELAARTVGARLVTAADAEQVAGMQRGPGDRFAAEAGAYRVLGHSGSASSPDQVMVEVTAPLTLAGSTGWRTVGGVIGWTPVGWQLISVQPRQVAQPTQARANVETFSDADRARTLAGLGWRAFAAPVVR